MPKVLDLRFEKPTFLAAQPDSSFTHPLKTAAKVRKMLLARRFSHKDIVEVGHRVRNTREYLLDDCLKNCGRARESECKPIYPIKAFVCSKDHVAPRLFVHLKLKIRVG